MDFRDFYKNKRVLITGGTGFIGSNLAFALVPLSAHITILASSTSHVDTMQDVFDAAEKNGKLIELVIGDIRDAGLVQKIVEGKDILFNLAAKVSHMDKGVVSYEDLDINVRGQLNLLEACRTKNPKVKVIFTSTRMVYGENTQNPITESHPTDPVTLYGIHKLTAEKYHLAYARRYGLRPIILRIGNPYGDRQHFSCGLYSLPGWFMDRVMKGETVEILSDGKQLRDYIYVGDLAEMMLRAGAVEKCVGKIYNAGVGVATTFGDMVKAIGETVKTGTFVYRKNPTTTSHDSYSFDTSLLARDLGWKPETKLEEGVRRMYTYAQTHDHN